jgi:hypothetical protein
MIKFHGDDGFRRDLRKLFRNLNTMEEKLKDRTDPLQKIKKRQVKRWDANFNSQGGLYGAWEPLAEDFTVSRRSKPRSNRRPLYETGALYRHFGYLNNRGEVTNDAIYWNMGQGGSTDGTYAIFHHFGYENRGLGGGLSPVPARVLWAINADDRDAAEEIMFKWVDDIIDRWFGV